MPAMDNVLRRIVTPILLGTLAGFATWVASPQRANAVVLTSGCANVNVSCTMQELIQNQGSAFIDINNIFFNNFDMARTSAAMPANAALIKVIPVDQGGRVGLRFEPIDPSANPWVAQPNGLDLSGHSFFDEIFYDVRNFNPQPLTATVLSASFMTGGNVAFPSSYVNSEGYSGASFNLTASCANVDDQFGDCYGPGGIGGATDTQYTRIQPSSSFSVDTTIYGSYPFLSGCCSGIVAVMQVTELYDVPEPASLAVLGAGLLGLGLRRRRRTS